MAMQLGGSGARQAAGELGRRGLLGLAATALLLPSVARAGFWADDVGVYAEPTLAPGLAAAGRMFTARNGADVAILTAPAPLLLEQIQRNPSEDVLMVPAGFMGDAIGRGFVLPETRRDGWRNRLVIAAAAGAAATPPGDLASLLAAGRIAVTDATEAASLDGHAVLEKLGLTQALGERVQGVASTADAGAMVKSGAARFALIYQTDLRADPGLALAASLPTVPPVRYAMALNRRLPSRNAAAFFEFLAGPDAMAQLVAAGLERAA